MPAVPADATPRTPARVTAPAPATEVTGLLFAHVEAYAALIACDLDGAQRQLARTLLATVALGAVLLVLALLGAAFVLASQWNTPDRDLAFAGLFGMFGAAALALVVYLALRRPLSDAFARSVTEWQLDRQRVGEFLRARTASRP